MNRRSFLKGLAATAAGILLPEQVLAEPEYLYTGLHDMGMAPFSTRIMAFDSTEVTLPVEPCPCQCSNDDGVTWFECDEAGEPWETGSTEEPVNEIPVNADDIPVTTDDWEPGDELVVTTLPNTGTGPS
jgi:hypothetical protein